MSIGSRSRTPLNLGRFTASISTRPFDFSKLSQDRTKAQLSFQDWLRRVTPTWTWDWAYQLHIQAQLQRVTDGEIDRLMLLVPPRHGKSELASKRLPAFSASDMLSCRNTAASTSPTARW